MRAWRSEALRFRHRDPAFERHLPGAALLLDACALVDLSVAEALALRRQAGEDAACGPGCAHCCRQPIPLSPLEALGLEYYLRLHLNADQRQGLREHLAAQAKLAPLNRHCPLLLDERCQAYALRPLACRRYVALGRACAPGEDAAASRPHQVLQPQRALLSAALARTLPWYAAWEACPAAADSEGVDTFFRSVTTLIQCLPWETMLAEKNFPA